MSFARVRLIVAATAYAGWMAWLGYAVLDRGTVPLVSRAQLTGASLLVLAELRVGTDKLPEPTAVVVEVLRGEGTTVGQEVEVTNLPAAKSPDRRSFHGGGVYLIPLIPNGDGKTFRVAGLPRSPGYEATTPEIPVVYPWTDEVRMQVALSQ